jgi:hypothetical protein
MLRVSLRVRIGTHVSANEHVGQHVDLLRRRPAGSSVLLTLRMVRHIANSDSAYYVLNKAESESPEASPH